MAHPQPLGFMDVLRLLGDVSPATVERILEAGGSFADLEIAYLSLMGDSDRLEGELGPLAGKAAEIFDILIEDPMLARTADR